MFALKKICMYAALGVGVASLMSVASARELAAGTVINASNFDQLKNDTFEQHTIASMVPSRLEWLIKKHGLTIRLAHSKPIHMDPGYIKRTKEHAGEAKINPKTHEMENWSGSGAPFPYDDISAKDPLAGWKLIWDFYVEQVDGDYTHFPRFAYLLIDGNKGIERTQVWSWYRVKMVGLISEDHKPVQGDGSILNKTQISAVYPQDIRGLGTLTIRYMADKVDNTWAYLPAVRRVRRLSGGAWMDPIGGTDQLQDDINIWNARPNWYPHIKVLRKQWMLVTAHSKWSWNEKGGTDAQKYPEVDLQHKPYWNPKTGWEPRQVYVVEADAPDIHPYSKKIMYVDAKFPWIWQGEAYDKKGKFWKYMFWLAMEHTCRGNGTKVIWPAQGEVLDYQRMHGTVFVSNNNWTCNPKGLKPSDVSLGSLMAAGR
ncbi:MAG TPA: DUF1329 domain-containing protein [Gammaproteobacteria bacterium]|nr:DUF1329 domain-containing protein [Gammaproteobacteria bacterium]